MYGRASFVGRQPRSQQVCEVPTPQMNKIPTLSCNDNGKRAWKPKMTPSGLPTFTPSSLGDHHCEADRFGFLPSTRHVRAAVLLGVMDSWQCCNFHGVTLVVRASHLFLPGISNFNSARICSGNLEAFMNRRIDELSG